jgi:hypothetical protein
LATAWPAMMLSFWRSYGHVGDCVSCLHTGL